MIYKNAKKKEVVEVTNQKFHFIDDYYLILVRPKNLPKNFELKPQKSIFKVDNTNKIVDFAFYIENLDLV